MYNFKEIEQKQQLKWREDNLFKADPKSNRKKYYVLEMLPYPSGALHMGHVRNYSIGDAVARFRRMKGYEVLHPMGWDSFGLPAENAAIKRGIAPSVWTDRNIEHMKRQLNSLGLSYDWSREIKTSSPKYYRWNQWLFSKMYEKGLAYKKRAFVNWSESLQTVLANEQVESSFCDGRDIVQKELNQWFYKITDYSERLLKGLDSIDWPENVKLMQRNWIGRSEGVELSFDLPGFESIEVFTTRLDTIYGVTYVAISMGHSFARYLADSSKDISEYIKNAPLTKKDKISSLKRGIFTGHYAVNPINGKRVPLWIADYVLDYGTKAVMGVPAHDERDYDFAMSHNLDLIQVLESDVTPFVGYSRLMNSEQFSGLDSEDAIDKIGDHLGVSRVVNYKLKDWLISRQRYWGTPIPVHYEGDDIVLERDLPLLLPEDVSFDGKGNPISSSPTFRKDLNRESDTMDTFVDSSWYYLRYLDSGNDDKIFDSVDVWPQVDLYIGGVEHAVMHLLYSRFIHKVLYDLGLVKVEEPFQKLLTQGMVLSYSYYHPKENRYYFPNEVSDTNDFIVTLDKMSKSKNNGVSPEEISEEYGVDAVRLFILFAAPPEKDLEWSERGVSGARRFLNRVWNLSKMDIEREESKDSEESKHSSEKSENSEDNKWSSEQEFLYKHHLTISKVTKVLEETLHLNVAIAALMEFTNDLYNYLDRISSRVWRDGFIDLIKMLSPFAPHMTDEIYQSVGGDYLLKTDWPKVNEEYIVKSTIKLPLQVNGKFRATLSVDESMSREDILAKAREVVKKHISKGIKREIYVDRKILNFVV